MVRFRKIIFVFVFSGIFAFLHYSCENTCTSQMTANREIKLGFVKRTSTAIVDSTVGKVYVYAMKASDTIKFYWGVQAAKVGLELDQNNDSSVFYFKTDSLRSAKFIDTLIFTYHREIQLISSECGFNTIFSLLNLKKYTNHIIDTVYTIVTDVNSDVDKNYKIALKTR